MDDMIGKRMLFITAPIGVHLYPSDDTSYPLSDDEIAEIAQKSRFSLGEIKATLKFTSPWLTPSTTKQLMIEAIELTTKLNELSSGTFTLSDIFYRKVMESDSNLLIDANG